LAGRLQLCESLLTGECIGGIQGLSCAVKPQPICLFLPKDRAGLLGCDLQRLPLLLLL
jgi:hypothetical protein